MLKQISPKPYSYIVLLFFLTVSAIWQIDSIQPHREFSSHFKEHYTSDAYNYEGKNVISNTKSGSGKYEDYDGKKVKTKEDNNKNTIFFNLHKFNWLFYSILVAAIIYLAYIVLSGGSTGILRANKNKTLNDIDDFNAEHIEHADIMALINQAEANMDFRLAIRFYYVLVLKAMSLKDYITLEDDKTNAEYLNEISHTPFSEAFAHVSYLYDYIWYGKFILEPLQYTKAKQNFTSLLKRVK